MEIRLKRLHLENFKCHKSMTIDFDGRNASIYGDNATGKTSIYDAFVWLLFGKDSAGNGEKNIDIKPLAPDGSVLDHQAVTEVEAVLLADGEEISLKRTYQEVWSTKRGSSEATYDGNTSEYFVDGVPCKANAYKARVAELVDEDRFRLLTTVNYFPAVIPWQKRREALFSLFGGLSDKQIMETDSRFQPLYDAMGKLSLDDYKKKITQKRKGFLNARNEIPARISECEKTIDDLCGLDFDGARAEAGILSARRDQLQKELLSIEQNTAVQQKQLELREAKMELDKLETENRRFRDDQRANQPDTGRLTGMIQKEMDAGAAARRRLDRIESEIQQCDERIQAARDGWKSVKSEQFSGHDTCPTCGQTLPADQIQRAMEAFEADKNRRCAELVNRSDEIKRQKEQCQKEAEEIRAYIANLETEIADMERNLEDVKNAAAACVASDMPDYFDRKDSVTKWISNAQRELDGLRQDATRAGCELRRRISEVNAEIAKANEIVGKQIAYQYAQSRIGQLREDARCAADSLGELDRMLYLMDEYSRYKASFVEGSINEHFALARFRLFREQANGGVEDRCDVVYDGVPYIGLNNGMKINVGIDIINVLSRAYGVTVPLFVDNAESVTNLKKSDCQVIRLVVSENDKELRIEHES